jgi:GNAT superfamily N-acetyltransferase
MGSAGTDLQVALRFLPEFFFALIPIIFFQPLVIFKRIIHRLISKSSDFKVSSCEAILRSIGVPPEARGHGIAERLLKEFEAQAILNGAIGVTLTTDADGNGRALAFYFKNGFYISQKFYQYDTRAMYLMKKNLI